ncbi:MAG: hypothetical protein J0H74_09205 [Chitinophagaceae bacterium]|nr:hypothetical protein [Chitinophagaceae bacterium]
MSFVRTIQWKALLMLAVFAVNFMVICHCSVRTMVPACCAKKETRHPCNDDNGCSGMHAVKFNLLEKQAAPYVELAPVYAIVLTREELVLKNDPGPRRVFSDKAFYTGSPPDLQSLYQCFRI